MYELEEDQEAVTVVLRDGVTAGGEKRGREGKE